MLEGDLLESDLLEGDLFGGSRVFVGGGVLSLLGRVDGGGGAVYFAGWRRVVKGGGCYFVKGLTGSRIQRIGG